MNPMRVVVLVCCAVLLLSACKKKEPPSGPPPVPGTDAAGASTLTGAAPGPRGPAVADRPAVLAELASGAPPPAGEFVFAESGGGVAWVEQIGNTFRVMHNGRPGRSFDGVGPVVLSPDGSRCAYPALADGKWRVVVDGRDGPPFAAVEAPVFSPDGAHVAYTASEGDGTRLLVDGRAGARARTRYLMLAFSGDSSRIVFVEEGDEPDLGRLVISDLSLERQSVVDPRVLGAVLDPSGSSLAAIAAVDGGQRVISLPLDRPERVTRGPVHGQISQLNLSAGGRSLAYVADGPSGRRMVLDDREEPISAGDAVVTVPIFRPDGRGVAAGVVSGEAVSLRHFFEKGAPSPGAYSSVDDAVYAGDGRTYAFAAKKPGKSIVVVNGKEGVEFDKVVTPQFSPDGRYVVYRARKDGKRFVVVADTEGKTVRQHPAYEQVFPVKFTADGKSVAYGVKDGRQLAWKVEPL